MQTQLTLFPADFLVSPIHQPGKRLGKEDERHLWPEMLRAIREIAPRFVVGENVRGLTNWNGGLVFDEVCAELENLGYQVAPVVIPACGVNAPHKRERIWFVAANTKCKPTRSDRGTNDEAQGDVWRGNTGDVFGTLCNSGVTTNTNGTGGAKDNGNRKPRFNDQKSTPNNWDNFPTQSPICGGDDGLPRQLDNITFSNWRQESIKGYGNAIVPQVALEIFKAIERVDNEML